MDCSQAQEQLELYLLGVLEGEAERALEFHLNECSICGERIQEAGESFARFASSLPRLSPPKHLKQGLFCRIDSENRSRKISFALKRFLNTCNGVYRVLAANMGKPAAVLFLAGVVFSAVWYNNRPNEPVVEEPQVSIRPTVIDETLNARPIATMAVHNETSGPRLASIVSAEAQLKEMTQAQRYFMYRMFRESTPQVTAVAVRELQGDGSSSRPRGRIFYNTSSEALLLALDLPPLPVTKVYQIWLVKDSVRYSAGTFTVDSTGYGKAVIIPVAPFAEFEAIGITIEPAEGSQLPTGTSVLKGDL
jgi:hypothetical protein